jgi:Smg protein
MIDILVYLFETYGYADACPAEPEQLARKLSAAGFEEGEISDAIEWLEGLREIADNPPPVILTDARAFRVFNDEEQVCLDASCRGFLAFLEASGVLNASQREVIIERAMALPDGEVSLSKFKIIVLMVLWQQQASLDMLVLDELLTEEVEEGEDASEWTEAVTVH